MHCCNATQELTRRAGRAGGTTCSRLAGLATKARRTCGSFWTRDPSNSDWTSLSLVSLPALRAPRSSESLVSPRARVSRGAHRTLRALVADDPLRS